MNGFWKLTLACWLGLAALSMVSAQDVGSQASPGQSTPRQPAAPDSTDILRVGERIVIYLADIPNGPPPQEVVISEDGKITLHLDKTFHAAGKTRTALEKEIKDLYVPNFYARMTVTVKQEDRFVYVGGFVKQPNRYPFTPGLTLLKAISVAGDFSEFGDKTEVTITRADGRKEVVDCKKAQTNSKLDRPLFPNDRIYVPRRFF
ncbi:MAG: SLBB domain-containing protein [Limisphaerales bacterium]